MFYCKKCGAEIHDGERFCYKCGATVAESERMSVPSCPKCGAAVSDDEAFCYRCGTELNKKTEAIIQSKDFLELINNYTSLLNNLLNKNEFLSKKFNDYNAEDLGKSLKKNNLFANNHSILLNDGTQINTLQQWNSIVDEQLKEIYNDATLKKSFKGFD